MWVELQSLEALTLSGNHLTEIPPDGFSNMPALESLDLGSSQLMTLTSDIIYLHNRPSRLYLGLVDNPLQCDSSLCWLKEAVENRKVEIYNRLRCANERHVFFTQLDCTSGNQYLVSFNYFILKILLFISYMSLFSGSYGG